MQVRKVRGKRLNMCLRSHVQWGKEVALESCFDS